MSELRGRHEAVVDQYEMFGQPKEDMEKVPMQVVMLEIRNASDVRQWYWDDVLNEDEVRLVGWTQGPEE